MSSIPLLSYNQQKQSSEIFSFSSLPHHNFNGMGFNRETLPYSRHSSFSSTSSEERSSCSDEESELDEGSESDGPLTNWKKQFEKICGKLEERDRCYEVEFLLRRKSLQLCSHRSLPLDIQHNPTTMNPTNCTVRRGSNSEFNSSPRRSSFPSTEFHPNPKTLLQMAKELRSNCDKILDRTVPFLIDSSLLWTIGEAVNQVTTNRVPPQDTTEDYEAAVLFLSDFFEQTPSLAIVLSDPPNMNPIGESLDLTLFRSLEFLELRKVPPHFVSGLNTLRTKLRRLKCTRNIESIEEIFSAPCCAEVLSSAGKSLISSPALTSVWPELREIDVSFNRLSRVDTPSLDSLPALEILNLSRNRISSVDSGFSRILHTLTVLNLNFNQLSSVPPTPPNLKILLLSNNFIPTLLSRHPLPQSLESLDLSQNVISDERGIEPLSSLSSLRTLSLLGNPITYSPKYRRTLASHLSRNLLQGKGFLLDQKKLSSSELRFALESKRRTPPMNPPSFLLTSNRSTTVPSKGLTKDRLGDLRSLTDSIDSSSSSLRSACRKKARIREVVILDREEEESSSGGKGPKTKGRRSSESSSSSIEQVPTSEEIVKATGEALLSIRQKYGEEFWLFRQAGQDVSNLLHIKPRTEGQGSSPPKKPLAISRSAPLTTSRDASFYSALSEWELTATTHRRGTESQDSETTSDESIKPLDELTEEVDSEGLLFYSCQDNSISSTSSDSPHHLGLEIFKDPTGKAKYFRTFENGTLVHLIILDNFLYQVDPSDGNSVMRKWDLKSLKSLREEKRIQETETVHFIITFDTRRKELRQKNLIMPLKDFKLFQGETNGFLEARTLQEFGQGFQCAKCGWEFSRGMANSIVVLVKGGKGPTQVPVCPNPNCGSELLIPVDGLAEDPSMSTPTKLLWEPKLTSTPTRVPPEGRPPSSSCLGREKSISPTNTPSNSTPNPNDGKSESDIETLSCDESSSIEILAKGRSRSGGEGDSGSDVGVVEEGLEAEPHHLPSSTPHPSKGPVLGLPMTDSTSSGSCTGSICTQYEKTIPTYTTTTITPIQPIKYDYQNYGNVDHRLLLHTDINLFKHPQEKLLALVKVMVMTTSSQPIPSIVIFSNKKIYFLKIIGPETDKVESWLQNWTNFPFSRLTKMEVLIGRHAVGIDFSGKYFGLLFRDSVRTSNFIEFFLGDVCGEIPWSESPPFVQDFSQTQKALMSPTNPIAYFGILKHAYCATGNGIDKSYAVSAVVVTSHELMLVSDLSWLVNRTDDSVVVKHVRELDKLRQVESFEVKMTFVRLVFQLDSLVLKWELAFETEGEKGLFLGMLRSQVEEVPFISLSQPGLT